MIRESARQGRLALLRSRLGMADSLDGCSHFSKPATGWVMADPENLQEALVRLHELVEADPSLRDRLADESTEVSLDSLRELLVQRLTRAAAEACEAGSACVDLEAVVREIVQDDLVANPSTTPSGQMISECDELVLRWTEVSGSKYAIEDAAGRSLGEIQRVVAAPDLRFDVLDHIVGQTYAFRRSGDQLYILDELDAQLGFVHFKDDGSLPRRLGFKVISSLDRGMLHVCPRAQRPYQLQIASSIGDEIGTIERRFVGLGPFSSDTHRLRIRMQPGRISPSQRLGLIATALLAGIDDES
jgi:hypothetical protein